MLVEYNNRQMYLSKICICKDNLEGMLRIGFKNPPRISPGVVIRYSSIDLVNIVNYNNAFLGILNSEDKKRFWFFPLVLNYYINIQMGLKNYVIIGWHIYKMIRNLMRMYQY